MEVTLLAHFTFPEQAEKARDALIRAGMDVVQVDSVGDRGRTPQEPMVEWGRYGYEPGRPDDKWTSAAAWDNALNLTGVNLGEAILLTAVIDEPRAEEARRLIARFGGRI